MALHSVKNASVEEFVGVAYGDIVPVIPEIAAQATYIPPDEEWESGNTVLFPDNFGELMKIRACEVMRGTLQNLVGGTRNRTFQIISLSRSAPGQATERYVIINEYGDVIGQGSEIASGEAEAFIDNFRQDMYRWLGSAATQDNGEA